MLLSFLLLKFLLSTLCAALHLISFFVKIHCNSNYTDKDPFIYCNFAQTNNLGIYCNWKLCLLNSRPTLILGC